MCGLAGIYNYGNFEPVHRGLLKAMTDTLVHRGPNDEGFYQDGPVGQKGAYLPYAVGH